MREKLNADEILDGPSNRKEEERILEKLNRPLERIFGHPLSILIPGGFFRAQLVLGIKETKEFVAGLKDIDEKQAHDLNDELDRLVNNLEGKKGKKLENAQRELYDFETRLNAIAESEKK